MGWSLGFDSNWNRWIGYGVPAYCDHPCGEGIKKASLFMGGFALGWAEKSRNIK